MTLAELVKDESLAKELFSKATPEEAQAYAASKGVEVSVAELKAIAAQGKQKSGIELSPDELDAVAGGASAFEQLVKLAPTLISPTIKIFETLQW